MMSRQKMSQLLSRLQALGVPRLCQEKNEYLHGNILPLASMPNSRIINGLIQISALVFGGTSVESTLARLARMAALEIN